MGKKGIVRRIRWRLLYVGTATLFWTIQTVPLSCSLAMARLLGTMAALLPGQRKLIMANLQIAFPEWEPDRKKKIVRAAWQNILITFFEFVYFLKRTDKILDYIHFPQEQQDIFTQGVTRNTILVSPHIGNWELGHLGLNLLGFKTSTVTAKMKNPYLEKALDEGRAILGAEIIHEHGAAKAIFRALKKERNLAVLIDQNTRPRRGGIFVDFFGLPVPVSRAPAMFARRSGVKIIVGCCPRVNGRPTVHLEALPKPPSQYESDQELTREINRVTEKLVERYPEQYLWMYRRWRHIPHDIDPERREKYPFYAKDLES